MKLASSRTKPAIAGEVCKLEFAAAVGFVQALGVVLRRFFPRLAATAQRAGEVGFAFFVERAPALLAILSPVVVGFGIDSQEKAKQAGAHADGVVVGTALVRRIEEAPTPDARLVATRALVASLREGLDALKARS